MPDRPVFMHEVNRYLYRYDLPYLEWEEKTMPISRFHVTIVKENGSSCTITSLNNEQSQFLKDIIANGQKVQFMEILQVIYQMTRPEEPDTGFEDAP